MGVLGSAGSLKETNHGVSIGMVFFCLLLNYWVKKMACHGGGGHVEYSLAIMVQSEPKVGG